MRVLKGKDAESPAAPATVNRWRARLSLIFRLALREGQLTANPCAQVQQLPEHNVRERYLTQDEETRLREVVAREYPHRVPDLDIALHTGLRMSEQYKLQWSDVDLGLGVVTIRHSKGSKGGTEHIRLNPAAVAAFERLRSPEVLQLRKALRRSGEQARESNGRVFDLAKPRAWFTRALRLARLENFPWHDLRHTVGTRMTEQGVPLRHVQRHRNIKTTECSMGLRPTQGNENRDRPCFTEKKGLNVRLSRERYAHAAPEYLQAAANSLMNYVPAPNRQSNNHRNNHRSSKNAVNSLRACSSAG